MGWNEVQAANDLERYLLRKEPPAVGAVELAIKVLREKTAKPKKSSMGRKPKSPLGIKAWEKGYTMQSLAEKVGMSTSALIACANGRREMTKQEAVRVYEALEGPIE